MFPEFFNSIERSAREQVITNLSCLPGTGNPFAPWEAIAYSPKLNRFVACSDAETGHDVAVSDDGVRWTIVETPISGAPTFLDLFQVTWIDGLDLFVITSYDVSTNGILTSPDGLVWTTRTIPFPGAGGTRVAYSPALGVLCTIGFNGGTFLNSRLLVSSDGGATWAYINPATLAGTTHLNDIHYSERLGLFVLTDNVAGNGIYTSPDLVTWTNRVVPATDNQIVSSIAESGALLVAYANAATAGTKSAITSPDGITWTERATPASLSFQIAWSSQGFFFTGDVSGFAVTPLVVSFDGITWIAPPYISHEISAGAGAYHGAAASGELALALRDTLPLQVFSGSVDGGSTWISPSIFRLV